MTLLTAEVMQCQIIRQSGYWTWETVQEAGEPVGSNDWLFSMKARKPFNQCDTSVSP
jgi:hypothetical protein